MNNLVREKGIDRSLCLDSLRESHLLSEEQMAELAERWFGDDPSSLLGALVEKGVLTRFQARQVWEGKARELVLGQYRLLDQIGRGGIGQVYKAVHNIMNRVVAIKVIAPELVENEQIRAWFRREVAATTELHHPNLVMAYDANEMDGHLFLVMEYIDGPNLHELVKEQGPLSPPLAREMLRQAALALQYAHEKGMVHRDIKPGNLLISRPALRAAEAFFASAPAVAPAEMPTTFATLVKVADFGLARLQHTSTHSTLMLQNERSFVGTPDYVSPEQARNVHEVDIRSDLYSLGCTFYFALSGQRPFKGATPLETVLMQLQDEPTPLTQLRPDVPAALEGIIRRLMAKDPDDRFASPAELIAALGQRSTNGVASCGVTRASAADNGDVPPATSVVADLPVGRPAHVAGAIPADGKADQSEDEGTPADEKYLRTTVVSSDLVAQPPPLPAVDGQTNESAARSALASQPDDRPAAEQQAAAESDPATISAPLKQRWRQWAEVVHAVARDQERFRIDEQAYRDLYRQLLHLCRSELATSTGGKANLLRQVEGLVEPWLTSGTLLAAEPTTRESLLLRCQQLTAELGLRHGGVGLWVWAILFFAAAVAGGVAFWMLQ